MRGLEIVVEPAYPKFCVKNVYQRMSVLCQNDPLYFTIAECQAWQGWPLEVVERIFWEYDIVFPLVKLNHLEYSYLNNRFTMVKLSYHSMPNPQCSLYPDILMFLFCLLLGIYSLFGSLWIIKTKKIPDRIWIVLFCIV